MENMKAALPQELKKAMALDDDQFEELECDTLDKCMNFVSALKDVLREPAEMVTAWRPTRNPSDQYFDIRHRVMVDPVDNGIRHEVVRFKPMNKSEYRAYCLKEFGSDPFAPDPSMN
jgi:hypothetical protein